MKIKECERTQINSLDKIHIDDKEYECVWAIDYTHIWNCTGAMNPVLPKDLVLMEEVESAVTQKPPRGVESG